ncbi:ATP-dependent DNA helicase [Cellulosimicrobium protaetiae]|uniref:ATP-dependent helicase DinG n=2 Tax=Cellulosimicrobium protaetiae TaxID=2587808 RepID=A0A6M5ULY4_9MICO|nr:ATP-dependent DNA helicase [Cellulosimicrobium protaetiae]
MARAVTEAIEGSEHLVVQAGTGTGKSLGYLVPAVRHAVATDERVIVSTATLALQRQVITRDLPLVADAVADELPRPATIALLKGWHNYLCVHKIAGGYPADEPTLFDLPGESAGAADHPAARGGTSAAALGEQVVRLREWADETPTGDRDDLVPGVSDKAWRQVSVTALECLGQRCPLLAECFPEKARATAREADVVVTNHAMLGIAAMGSPGVLPEHDVLVVDEAHELADRVTAAATVDLSVPAIESAARLARRHGGVTTDALDAASAAFGTVVGALPAERFPDGLPDGARSAVAAVRDAAREVLSTLKPETGVTKPAQPDSGLKMAQSTMLQLFEVAERMAADPTGHDVLWCSRPGEGGWSADRFGEGASRLHAAPLGVAGLIRTHLLAERTGVFTSATLALGGSFDAVARTFGLGSGGEVKDADAPRWRGLDVGSPFDYARQGILYVAKRLPTPGREASTEHQLDEIAALVEAAGGRTLGLFSSRRAAVAAAEAMRERLDVPILCQGDDQLPTLVREFADDPATCLFGTLSLWQGVDVPGPSCQLVLIDRIPFPRPDDPVKSARARAVEAAGGNGFMQVSATHAALLLAQGAGRLVRSTADRGVVAVLDPRLVTARYGTFLTRSMPGFWQTTDRDVATAALRRLAALG